MACEVENSLSYCKNGHFDADIAKNESTTSVTMLISNSWGEIAQNVTWACCFLRRVCFYFKQLILQCLNSENWHRNILQVVQGPSRQPIYHQVFCDQKYRKWAHQWKPCPLNCISVKLFSMPRVIPEMTREFRVSARHILFSSCPIWKF